MAHRDEETAFVFNHFYARQIPIIVVGWRIGETEVGEQEGKNRASRGREPYANKRRILRYRYNCADGWF